MFDLILLHKKLTFSFHEINFDLTLDGKGREEIFKEKLYINRKWGRFVGNT